LGGTWVENFSVVSRGWVGKGNSSRPRIGKIVGPFKKLGIDFGLGGWKKKGALLCHFGGLLMSSHTKFRRGRNISRKSSAGEVSQRATSAKAVGESSSSQGRTKKSIGEI